MRIVFSTRYTLPVHRQRVKRLGNWVAMGRRARRRAATERFLNIAFGE